MTTCTLLSELMRMIRRHMVESDQNMEESTVEILSQQRLPNAITLVFDAVSLDGEIEERIFHSIMTSNKYHFLYLYSSLDANDAATILQTAVTATTNTLGIILSLEMTEVQAERFFSILHTTGPFLFLYVLLGHSSEALCNPLAKFLREDQSLSFLSLGWVRFEIYNTNMVREIPVTVPGPMVRSICDGIADSTCLKKVSVGHPPPATDAAAMAAFLACAVVKSSSIDEFIMGGDFVLPYRRALLCTTAVQNFELSFRRVDNKPWGDTQFVLNRNVKWQRFLTEDIPLEFWSHALAQAGTWNQEDSHAPFDAVFFLLKEKNDVLISDRLRNQH